MPDTLPPMNKTLALKPPTGWNSWDCLGWAADIPDSKDKYLAFFNQWESKEPFTIKVAFEQLGLNVNEDYCGTKRSLGHLKMSLDIWYLLMMQGFSRYQNSLQDNIPGK
jgi:hypothetical protein